MRKIQILGTPSAIGGHVKCAMIARCPITAKRGVDMTRSHGTRNAHGRALVVVARIALQTSCQKHALASTATIAVGLGPATTLPRFLAREASRRWMNCGRPSTAAVCKAVITSRRALPLMGRSLTEPFCTRQMLRATNSFSSLELTWIGRQLTRIKHTVSLHPMEN